MGAMVSVVPRHGIFENIQTKPLVRSNHKIAGPERASLKRIPGELRPFPY